MQAGDTFFAPLPPNNTPHLFVVISDPHQDIDQIVVAPFMSIDAGNRDQELVCELKVGDHPFIRHASFVNFDCCFSPSLKKITDRKLDRKSKPVSPTLLNRIRDCARKSELIALRCLDILTEQGLIEP